MLEAQVRHEGSTAIVTIEGKITFDKINQLNRILQDALSAHQPQRLVLNLANVTHIDSSGVGLLVASRNIMNRNMGQLYLCGLCPYVLRVFSKMNLLNYFSIFATELDALEETSRVAVP